MERKKWKYRNKLKEWENVEISGQNWIKWKMWIHVEKVEKMEKAEYLENGGKSVKISIRHVHDHDRDFW